MIELVAGRRIARTPFGLMGTDENALSHALAYTFQQCPHLLQWFLKQVGVGGLSRSQLAKTSISTQRHSSNGTHGGITDIELQLPSKFHVVIEAKIGLSVPTLQQCRKYLPRFRDSNAPIQKLVSLIQSPDEQWVDRYCTTEPLLQGRLDCFNWSRLIPVCIRMMNSDKIDLAAKQWVRAFYQFMDKEYAMKAYTTEVWILSASTTPLWKNGKSHWDIHQEYNLWWDYKEHSVRPLYLAFRTGGKLEYIGRVNQIEHDRSIIDAVPEMRKSNYAFYKQPATIWHFDQLIKLPSEITTGPGMYNRRVRCHLDLLLTCATVKEIEDAMSERRQS